MYARLAQATGFTPPCAKRAVLDMTTMSPGDSELMAEVERYLGYHPQTLRVHTDTSNFWAIDRGDVLALAGHFYLVAGTMREQGFGLDDEPKYWVKRAIDCENGSRKIIKLVFLEQFNLRLGDSIVRCFRSPAKEARVLERVHRHPQFMRGFGIRDAAGNDVRVIDFIPGPNLERLVWEQPEAHEAYFHGHVPTLLRRLLPCLEGLRFLHEQDERHGDVRPDHVILDDETGLFRWIDFDYEFAHPEAPFSLDILGVGNIIAMIVGKGVIDSHRLDRDPALAGVLDRLGADDLSLIDRGRLMNLRKAYPYIPEELNRVLLHFSGGAEIFYDTINEVLEDLGDAVSRLITPDTAGGETCHSDSRT